MRCGPIHSFEVSGTVARAELRGNPALPSGIAALALCHAYHVRSRLELRQTPEMRTGEFKGPWLPETPGRCSGESPEFRMRAPIGAGRPIALGSTVQGPADNGIGPPVAASITGRWPIGSWRLTASQVRSPPYPGRGAAMELTEMVTLDDASSIPVTRIQVHGPPVTRIARA